MDDKVWKSINISLFRGLLYVYLVCLMQFRVTNNATNNSSDLVTSTLYNTESGLNNFREYSMINPGRLASSLGFTPEKWYLYCFIQLPLYISCCPSFTDLFDKACLKQIC